MIRRVIAVWIAALLVASCTQTGDKKNDDPTPEEPTDPVVAFVLPTEGDIETTRILANSKTKDVKGFLRGFLPNGSVLLDRYLGGDIDQPSYPVIIDPATGRETSGKEAYNADAGVVGFGRDSLLVVTDDGKKHSLSEFDTDFKKIREVALPGRSGVGEPDVKRSTAYGDPVGGDGVVFLVRSEWEGVESVSDSVTRVDAEGQLTTLFKDKHVDQIALASDGQSLIASVAEEGPYYEGGAPLADIVELDARSGKIVRSYGIPEPCTTFEPLFDDASCVDKLDKVGGVVAVTLWESKKPVDDLDAYSTWMNEDGEWTEVKSQRNKRVAWQSTSGRVQHQVDLRAFDEEPANYPIEWVVGDKVTKLPGTTLGAFDWFAPGSLIQP